MKRPGQIRPQFLTHEPIVLGKEINITMPNGEKHNGRFAIVDLDSIIASHNEVTFQSSVGYPLNDDGTNINDRNYLDDINAQKLVADYARNLDPERMITTSRTPSGTAIITRDGIVVSGNNRTMSAKLAAKQHPEKYKEYLDFFNDERLAFGFPEIKSKLESNIKYPYLVRIDYDFQEYTTEQLAKYNKDTKKSERPIDKAIKLSQILRNNKLVFSRLSDIIGKYETFTEFYANHHDTANFAKALVSNGVLTEQELPAFYEGGDFTEGGKDFIEQMLAAMVLNKDSLLATNLPGVKKYRQTLITSLTVLIANSQLSTGSLNNFLNQAIMFAYEMAKTDSTLFDILNQQQLFEKVSYNRKAVVLNRLLDSGRNNFKQAIEKYNEAIKKEEVPSMFGDKLGPDQIFKLVIESKISKQDIDIINASKLVVDGNNKSEPVKEEIHTGFPIDKYSESVKKVKGLIEGLVEKYKKTSSEKHLQDVEIKNDTDSTVYISTSESTNKTPAKNQQNASKTPAKTKIKVTKKEPSLDHEIQVGEQILFDQHVKGGIVLIVCNVTEVREKAVKVDFAQEPVSVGHRGGHPVFTYTMWLPKSVIISEPIEGTSHSQTTVKKWFANKGFNEAKKFHIKKYMLEGDKKIYV